MGLGHLHDKKIAHRDLKPENVILDNDGYIKLIDFGLSKVIDGDELTRTQCGTIAYMAPEILENAGHNKNCDWWALGVMLYELLFGVNPFADKRITKI